MFLSSRQYREYLLFCLFLTVALFFVTIRQNGVTFVQQQASAAVNVDAMTTRELLNRAVSKGYTTKNTSDAIVQALDFDRVFTFLTIDELLDALRHEGLLTRSDSNSVLMSRMQSNGIPVSSLRPDGIITAMATLPGGPLLVQKPGRQLWHIATDSKDVLRQWYIRDPYAFLDILTPLRLFTLLENRIQITGTQRKSWVGFSSQKVLADTTSLIDKVNVQDGRTPAQTKALTDAQPAQKRMVQIMNYQADSTFNEGLNPPLREADGSIARKADGTPLYSLWLDEWEAIIRPKFENFFRDYKAQGGQLNTVSIDIEIDWLGMYHARNIWFAGKENLIFADPRWPALEQELRQAGIQDFTGLAEWYVRSDYRGTIWDAVMERRQVAAFNRAIFEPIRTYFPNVTFTNYENYHKSQTVPVSDYRRYPRSEYGIGTIQGTHQAVSIYDEASPTVRKDGIVDAPSDANAPSFERFMGNVKAMRTMAAASKVPIMPWIAHPDYTEARKGGPDHVYYTEAIFHTGLNGADQYLLWVWSELKSVIGTSSWDAGMRVLDTALKELSDIAGYEGGKTLSFTNVDYQDDYVLTGYEVANKRIWRFTPRPGVAVSLTSQSNPVIFTVNGKRIEFSQASSITPNSSSISTLGYWITETQGKTLLTRSADEVYALLQQDDPAVNSSSSSQAFVSSVGASSSTTSNIASTSSSRSSSASSVQHTSSATTSQPSSATVQNGTYMPILVSDTERTLTDAEAERLARADRRVVENLDHPKLHGAYDDLLEKTSSASSRTSSAPTVSAVSSSSSSTITKTVTSAIPQLKSTTKEEAEQNAAITWADFPRLHVIWNWCIALWHWVATKAMDAWQWASSQIIVSK